MPKKYYWFKMRADFFDSREIKRLQKIPGGDTYIVLYINLLSRSVKTEGCLHFDHVEDSFAEELSLILDSNVEAVNFLLKFLIKYDLLTVDGDNYYFLEAIGNIGKESESTNRVRKYRERQKKLMLTQSSNFNQEHSSVTSSLQSRYNVTVDNLMLQNGYNVTPTQNVTQDRYNVTDNCFNVTDMQQNRYNVTDKRYVVQKCNTEIEKEIEIEPSSSTKVNIDVSKPVDNFGLPIATGFEAFLKCYPRSQANSDAVYQPFCELIAQGVAISDLIAAAKSYADAIRKDNADPRYIKMPANFLSQKIWLKYRPKFQIDCPTCHGNGIIDYPPSDEYPNGHVDFCRCANRYKQFETDTIQAILAQLSDGKQQTTASDAQK